MALLSRTNLRWQLSPHWARVTVHKRLVLVLAICGALTGLPVSAATPKVYAARVLIHDSSQPGCGGFSTAPARPLSVRLASQVDAAALWLRLQNPQLEDRVSKWIDER